MTFAGAALIAVWLGVLLLYANYFSETQRDGGGFVKAAAWASLAAGIALVLGGLASLLRRSAVR